MNENLITYCVFVKQIKELKVLSDKLCDGWMIHSNNDDTEMYATKTVRKSCSFENFEETITFEYHIAYSISYRVPILCFNVFRKNGCMIPLEQCWAILEMENFPNKLSIFTQLDHPVLQKPFFTIHPCKTQKFMHECFKSSKNQLVSWLSAFAPLIGLEILPDYAKLTLV